MIHITQSALGQITEIFNKRKKAIGLSKYSVGDIFDHGGMSNIYKLTDGADNADYVLRISEEHKSPYSNDIFNVRELKILQELKKNRQPHVVQYLDAFAVDVAGYPRYYCAVMKFLSTLKQYRVNGDGVEIAVRLGGDFLPLLQSFTDKSILHRDIKPANIFYDNDFRNDTGFLLGDFGIAKRDTDTSVTPTGTESTMAPEVRALDRSLGSDRTRSDMYSLGVVMYLYLNEGIYPSNRERIDRMPPDTAPFPAPRYGSKRLKNLVIKATSYYPEDRFESPQDMLRELQKCEEYKMYIFNEDYGSEETMNAEEILVAENKALKEELEQKSNALEAAIQNASLQEQAFQTELDSLKAEASAREQELLAANEEFKAQASSREQTFLKDIEALKAQASSREQGLLAEIEELKGQASSREQELLAEIEGLKAQASSREQELLAEIEELKGQALSQEKEQLPAENEEPKAQAPSSEQELPTRMIHPQSEKSSQERIIKPKKKHGGPLDLHVGDRLRYGSFPQGSGGEVQPLIWRVLSVENGRALIISELLIDTMPYDNGGDAVTWETSALRHWLNNAFIASAFGGSLPQRVIVTTNHNSDNPKHRTKGGADTVDKVFALSIEEAEKYFHDNNDRMAGVTEYAQKQGAWVSSEYTLPDGEKAGLWWLRSPGYVSQAAARVLINGDINSHGSSVNRENVAVRPAMWIRTV